MLDHWNNKNKEESVKGEKNMVDFEKKKITRKINEKIIGKN
jgi:hypothetical protein